MATGCHRVFSSCIENGWRKELQYMDVYMPFIGMVFIWLLSSAIVSISREKTKKCLAARRKIYK
jgi:hypothetical protein